jgi:2-keto-4-pentenoate hydratase/2-oxohepta-3-ene-1,7-dioic acid hydratase in catechol pathway
MSYKLLSYQQGAWPRAGLLVDGKVYDAEHITGESAFTSVMGIVSRWQRAQPLLQATVDGITAGRYGAGQALADVKLLAPLLYPGAIYGAGANYLDHIREMERAHNMPQGPTMKEMGETPWHFIKSPRSTIRGPGDVIKLPAFSKTVDWEIELVAVIGHTASQVSVASALDYVAGYTIANDLSARDAMLRDKNPPSSPFRFDWVAHKSFDGSCPIGPWITPASDIGDPHKLGLKLWVDDELMQDSNTDQMVFDVAEQVAAISSRLTLHPGDLILTGTPAGVGMPRKVFLKPGQTVRLWIEKLGEMEHRLS